MAKKKRTDKGKKMFHVKQYVEPDGRILSETGVSVSLIGGDRGPPQLWIDDVRSKDDAFVIEQLRLSVRERVSVARRQNNLDRMLAAKDIDRRLFDGGVEFKKDFDRAHFSAFPSPKYEIISHSTGSGDDTPVSEAARKRLAIIIKKLGGYGSRHTSAAWTFIGLEQPIGQVVGSGGHGKTIAKHCLLDALSIITDHYSPQKKIR